MAYGTLTALDTLAAIQQSVAEYGENEAYEGIALALAAHNVLVAEMLQDLCEPTTANLDSYGGSSGKRMQELDETGTPDPQKSAAGVDIGYPLRLYGDALQWTATWWENHSVADLVKEIQDMMLGDRLNIALQVKRALYTPTNSTFKDRLVKGINLPIKALLNADSAAIPVGPNGETFDPATHTHYLANATWTQAVALSLINTVVEHRRAGAVRLYINATEEATTRTFADFKPILDARVVPSTTTTYALGQLDQSDPNDREIGVLGAASVWVKPWVVSGYPVTLRIGTVRPLNYRTRANVPQAGQFRLRAQHEHYPLRADMYFREFGISVGQRDAAAVAYIGGGSYVAPTLS